MRHICCTMTREDLLRICSLLAGPVRQGKEGGPVQEGSRSLQAFTAGFTSGAALCRLHTRINFNKGLKRNWKIEYYPAYLTYIVIVI